ncbi:MAG: hypothetical protein FJ295_11590 [Planctomycetes bacterium]|nr:hypothetical protein [Planctomycetota bacterium]
MFPARLDRDGEFFQAMVADLRMRLEQEVDYQREAAMLEQAHLLFRAKDEIVVPRVYRQFSTSRVLTMQRLPGVHLGSYLATDPPQANRNEYGRRVMRAMYRLLFTVKMIYADYHPGNLLFMDDGRLGSA